MCPPDLRADDEFAPQARKPKPCGAQAERVSDAMRPGSAAQPRRAGASAGGGKGRGSARRRRGPVPAEAARRALR